MSTLRPRTAETQYADGETVAAMPAVSTRQPLQRSPSVGVRRPEPSDGCATQWAMPRFEPFTGLRYDSARVDLSMVIAPPYDVIDPLDRERLARHHSANAVRVELPEPDHRAGLDRYQHAAALLQSWIDSGTLVADPGPRLYAYRMTVPNGRTSDGVIGALAIDPDGAAGILPHEQTLPKPKDDRLQLLRATATNLSPVWALSLTPGFTTTFVSDRPADSAATDDDGVLHQLWVIDDPAVIAGVTEAAGANPLVLADGHHRLETAMAYRADAVTAGEPQRGADLIMALVVELSEDQLQVGAYHRALSGLPDGLDLVDTFSSWFDVTRVGEATERNIAALGESGSLSLVMPSGAWLLSPKDGTPEAAGSPLDASMVALVIAELPDHELAFHSTWEEAARAVATEEAQAVILLRPVAIDQIAGWARAGRKMPPKSTYFHPKPRTGMVYRRLTD